MPWLSAAFILLNVDQKRSSLTAWQDEFDNGILTNCCDTSSAFCLKFHLQSNVPLSLTTSHANNMFTMI